MKSFPRVCVGFSFPAWTRVCAHTEDTIIFVRACMCVHEAQNIMVSDLSASGRHVTSCSTRAEKSSFKCLFLDSFSALGPVEPADSQCCTLKMTLSLTSESRESVLVSWSTHSKGIMMKAHLCVLVQRVYDFTRLSVDSRFLRTSVEKNIPHTDMRSQVGKRTSCSSTRKKRTTCWETLPFFHFNHRTTKKKIFSDWIQTLHCWIFKTKILKKYD